MGAQGRAGRVAAAVFAVVSTVRGPAAVIRVVVELTVASVVPETLAAECMAAAHGAVSVA